MISEKRPSITVDDQRASHLFHSICPILAHHTHRKRTPMQLLYRNLSNSVRTIKKRGTPTHSREKKEKEREPWFLELPNKISVQRMEFETGKWWSWVSLSLPVIDIASQGSTNNGFLSFLTFSLTELRICVKTWSRDFRVSVAEQRIAPSLRVARLLLCIYMPYDVVW
jgi:hypothetical protein